MIRPDQFLKAQSNQVTQKSCTGVNVSYSHYSDFYLQACTYGLLGYKEEKIKAPFTNIATYYVDATQRCTNLGQF